MALFTERNIYEADGKFTEAYTINEKLIELKAGGDTQKAKGVYEKKEQENMKKKMTEEKKMTGYPSIDKPWLKYYRDVLKEETLGHMSMYDYLKSENKDNLNGVSLDYMGQKINYKTLFQNIDKVACALQQWGIKENEIIPTFALNVPEFVYVFYALNKIGAIPDLEYMNISEKDLKNKIQTDRPKHIIAIQTFLPVLDRVIENDMKREVLILPIARSLPLLPKLFLNIKMRKINRLERNYFKWSELINQKYMDVVEVNKHDDKPALIVHTGGTTGIPKGVVLSSYNANAIAFQYKNSLLRLNRGDTILNIAPPFVAFGICLAIHTPLCLGLHVQLSPNPDPDTNGRAYGKYKPMHFLGGPAHIKNIVSVLNGNRDMSFAKTVGYGGESIPLEEQAEYVEFFNKRGSDISHLSPGYGMTEFGGTVVVCGKDVYRNGSVGIPFHMANVKIVNPDTNAELKYNEVGEIWLTSPSLMIGYTNSECGFVTDENGKKWIKTGDLGYVDQDGFVFLQGRIKRMFLIKGADGAVTKWYPEIVEEIINKISKVYSCAVVAYKKNEAHYSPVAFIELFENENLTEQEIYEFCVENLPEYEVPDKIIILNKVPVTNSGKKDYRKLEKMADNILTKEK